MEFLYPDKARGELQRSSVSKITNETCPTRKCMGTGASTHIHIVNSMNKAHFPE